MDKPNNIEGQPVAENQPEQQIAVPQPAIKTVSESFTTDDAHGDDKAEIETIRAEIAKIGEVTTEKHEAEHRLPLPKRILVIEDQELMRDFLLDTLWTDLQMNRDLAVVAPRSIEELALALSDGQYGALFLDINLGDWQEGLESLQLSDALKQAIPSGGTVYVTSTLANDPVVANQLESIFSHHDIVVELVGKAMGWEQNGQTEKVQNRLNELAATVSQPNPDQPFNQSLARLTGRTLTHKANNNLGALYAFGDKMPLEKVRQIVSNTQIELKEVVTRLESASDLLKTMGSRDNTWPPAQDGTMLLTSLERLASNLSAPTATFDSAELEPLVNQIQSIDGGLFGKLTRRKPF